MSGNYQIFNNHNLGNLVNVARYSVDPSKKSPIDKDEVHLSGVAAEVEQVLKDVSQTHAFRNTITHQMQVAQLALELIENRPQLQQVLRERLDCEQLEVLRELVPHPGIDMLLTLLLTQRQ